MVRDDPSGMLTSALDTLIGDGLELLARGRLVEEDHEFASWRERRRGWRARCAELLKREFEREALEEYLHAAFDRAVPEECWRKAMHRELRRTENAIELLASLRGTLRGNGCAGGAKRRRPRRARERGEASEAPAA